MKKGSILFFITGLNTSEFARNCTAVVQLSMDFGKNFHDFYTFYLHYHLNIAEVDLSMYVQYMTVYRVHTHLYPFYLVFHLFVFSSDT